MTRQHSVDPDVDAAPPLTGGPRWYRTRIRTWGPLLGLTPMLVLGSVALIALRVGDGRASGLIGLFGGVSAAPGLLVVGAPFADESQYPLAVLASVPLWLVLGLIASRRATRSLVAGWADYWRELTYLTIGVVLGASGALIAAGSVLGESLIV